MLRALAQSGFRARPPEGAYYVMAVFECWGFEGSAEEVTRHLIHDARVATVPGTAFYFGDRGVGERVVRFAFAKTIDTLDRVAEQLAESYARR
jgi:aspartate/methionine/tyrosine aminotransferase